jgi:hypothetical protein
MQLPRNEVVWSFILGLAVFASGLLGNFYSSLLLQVIIFFGFLGLILMILYTGVSLLGRNSKKVSQKVFSLFLCVAFGFSFFITGRLAEWFSNVEFKVQIGKYTSVVQQLGTANIGAPLELSRVDMAKVRNIPRGVINIQAMECRDRSLFVFFYTSDVGRIHKGFIYKDPQFDACAGHEGILNSDYHLQHIFGGWYRFCDY